MNRPSLLLLAALAGCGGPAMSATRGYSVTDFSRLRIEGPYEVHVRVGQPTRVSADGPQDAIERLSIEQHDDVLVIRPVRSSGWANWSPGSSGKVVIDIAMRSLAGATLAGSGDVTVDRAGGDALALMLAGSGNLAIGAVNADRLDLTVTGSGNSSLAGRARQGQMLLTGAGRIDASHLAVDQAVVKLIGSGDVTLDAMHEAKVTLAGSGDVSITGPATCSVERSGSGDVRCAHVTRE